MGTQLGASTMIGKTMSLLLLSALLATTAAIPAPRVGDCAAADDYIDEVLANVAKMVVEQGYDPAELPGDEVHFSQDIGFITIHGSARYDQGHFDGLSTIHRTGETQLCVGDTIDVHANIGLRDARAGYHVAAGPHFVSRPAGSGPGRPSDWERSARPLPVLPPHTQRGCLQGSRPQASHCCRSCEGIRKSGK